MRRVVKYVRQGDFKKAAKSAGAAAVEIGTTVVPVAAGAKVGKIAGKAVARAVAKESGAKSLSAANKARGAGKMTYPKAATGKSTRTAPKRDVIVKTQDRTLATNGFINKSGEKSVKVATKNPRVRIVEKEVTKKQANQATASSNKLRYGGAKAEAQRTREAVGSSRILSKGGQNIGAGAGGFAVGSKRAKDKKKK